MRLSWVRAPRYPERAAPVGCPRRHQLPWPARTCAPHASGSDREVLNESSRRRRRTRGNCILVPVCSKRLVSSHRATRIIQQQSHRVVRRLPRRLCRHVDGGLPVSPVSRPCRCSHECRVSVPEGTRGRTATVRNAIGTQRACGTRLRRIASAVGLSTPTPNKSGRGESATTPSSPESRAACSSVPAASGSGSGCGEPTAASPRPADRDMWGPAAT